MVLIELGFSIFYPRIVENISVVKYRLADVLFVFIYFFIFMK
ncbi:hypothetical protein OMAG_001002 [Candidatus Omnitrophus magneticus]|uniref:Uncharacterized protein n=1 Tax=Candidatus Omnitrophus magneticus TaxID=1609969 RepID=A0A0F0CUB8_9BACT|nr:hypothetical protein OMAG_001002 [Candidatus Omnitrophus magneticus]